MKGDRGQVSVRGTTYDRLKIEAEARNKSMSQLVEELVEAYLGSADGSRQPQAVDSAPEEG